MFSKNLPITGILLLVRPEQASWEAHAGDGEQQRSSGLVQDHLIGPGTWVLPEVTPA